ncbi:uncharacterized protein KIAA1522 homolog [Cheilinus undulatus]|uniref:uncharacterized protein KIAA1522 homolog n=1 Tax=Cheilinus undulatus TaxID=241271 RepID=UPI001BD398F6|nr:uncharacterized protein KIAA1522 homolog [Cheilinus undulatus]XP_041668828.1 uncharacterized protein KIAA1522 homolog [Cheilinus undulatus]
MSNRDSLGKGDLIPQDLVDIFAQEKHGNRGRKKRSRSLGRALGWLKGKKKKDLSSKRQSPGLGPALDLAFDGPTGHQGGHKGGQKSGKQTHPQAVPKLDDDDRTPAAPLFQENVFIEASRPQYLENLHSEALEGLKMMQQEETNNGVEYRDNESTVSTMTVHTDGEGGGFMTDSTIADSTSVISVKSSVSTRSSRSGLTRQESTFRPLNSGKKSRPRRKHRKTVTGIPQHVQRELGLDRVGWTLAQKADEEHLYNGDTDESPTTEGLQQTATSQTGTTNIIHPLNKDQLDQLDAANASHGDNLALMHPLDPNLPADQRPNSLAVPWMPTSNSLQQELPSPVMSMSPQAAYMSKIIPNAVLPPSIDVVEISRGRSRNSVRTVSKSSLVLSSPASSRASSRASIRTTSSKASTITSASQNPPNMSDSSCWSNSESSETLVSDSSTISSSSTPRQKRSQDGNASAKEDKISVHSSISKASKGTFNGKLVSKREAGNKEGPFVRSLSVMKQKRAPPPPNRSYSLHNKMKRRSRDLAEMRVIPGEENVPNNKSESSSMPSKPIDSPGYNADTSSLDDSTGSASFSPVRSQLKVKKAEEAAKVHAPDSKESSQVESKQTKVVSPSSGYSSQEATSTQSLKQSHSSSPRHKRGLLAKLQRLFPGSAPSSPTPPPSENIKPADNLKPDPSVDSASPSVRALRELFNIPPHPKVHAPPAPPPEVWVHSRRSIELLLGPPVPDDIYAIIKKNPKDKRPHRQSPCASAESSVKLERKIKTAVVDGSTETKKVQGSVFLNAEVHKENNNRLAEKDEKVSASDILSGMLVKAVVIREERLAAREEEIKKVASPESSWPPPPPPVGHMVITDEMDFPLPPPPMFGEGLVIPVQVPPSGDSSSTNTVLNIPPPPPYTAPPPPSDAITPASLRRLSPLPPIKEVPLTPPPEEVSPPQPTLMISPTLPPPPPPMEIILTAPSNNVTPSLPLSTQVPPPPPPKDVSPSQQPKEISHPPPPIAIIQLQPTKEVTPSPPQPKVVAPPPPQEVIPPPPPKEISAPPPPQKVIILPPPVDVLPPPPPQKVIVPPPAKEISVLPPIQGVILLPPSQDVSPPPPPQEVTSSLPPPKDVVLSPPLEEVSSPPSKEISLQPPPPLPKEVSSPPPPPIKEVSTTLVTVVSPPSVEEASPPVVVEVSTFSNGDVPPPSSQEKSPPSSEEATPVSTLTPPQSIPPPPAVLSQTQEEMNPPEKCILSEPQTNPSLSNSNFAPPQSIPPPPPIQPPSEEECRGANSLAPKETPPPPPSSEVSIPPAPEKAQEPENNPPLPSAEPQILSKQTSEKTSTPVVPEEPTPIITPSLLQMVKLRSVNSSPEPPKAPEQSETEVIMRNKDTTSASGEAPQKPIRRSLIMSLPTSPTSTSPPAVIVSEPALPKSQSLVIPPTSSSTALSPTKKSPPAMIASPSMNLQEAIRLRTAARSKENPTSRLSLHSPTSPIDLRKSPTSTASFIFSKSNKRVVIETKPVVEKNRADVKKVEGEAEAEKKGVKVPPPVAKKPKAKGKETDRSEGPEQTAGQEAQQESIKDAAEKANGTAGTVEGEVAPST